MHNSVPALRENREPNETCPASVENTAEPLFDVAERSPRLRRLAEPSANPDDQKAPIRKILVATDFSPGSAKAVECAVAIANQCNAALTFLHVIDISVPAESETAGQLMER